ncbi:hypothetical protein ACFQZX_17410 [Mucilaginibacter litoreus]|uniref:Stearoyl-CoA desaturase (Delta-9 desaturase) n=1 Tax=Mucilaginibacter litoreus TaxID=1048221 RepID=A0ABW3AYB5_9SPHI
MARILGYYPEGPLIDRMGSSQLFQVIFATAYTCFYIAFVTHWWLFLLFPVHYLRGPIHGAIISWCGHKYGYTNFDNNDQFKNTTLFDFLMLGELFQNNYLRHPKSANSVNIGSR